MYEMGVKVLVYWLLIMARYRTKPAVRTIWYRTHIRYYRMMYCTTYGTGTVRYRIVVHKGIKTCANRYGTVRYGTGTVPYGKVNDQITREFTK